MKLGILIILHSLRMVWGNRAVALRIALAPVALMIGASVILRTPGTPIWSMEHAQTFLQVIFDALDTEHAFMRMLVWAFATAWMFVNRHRFILLSEYPKGWLPPVHKDAGLAYIKTALKLIGIWVVGVFFLIFVIAFAMRGSDWVFWVGTFVLFFAVFRLSPILPAAALGQKMGMGQALAATSSVNIAIAVIIVARYGASQMAELVVSGAADVNEGLGLIVWTFVTLFLSLLNVSIFTTLYGYCVEGRPLR